MDVVVLIIIYIVVMNIVGIASMAMDKWKAVHRSWRIPEATLFFIAFIGGSIGSIAGMYLCRHKTKKWYFVYGMPLILVLQLVLLGYLMFSGKFAIMW